MGGWKWMRLSMLRGVTIVLLMCASGLSMGGCGGSQNGVSHEHGLTRRVLSLEPGASIESARSQLGEPISDVTDGREDELNYGSWQLTFVDGRMTRRSKVIVPKHAHHIRESGSLERKILGLSLGTSIGEAKAVLGVPEVIYIIYERTPRPIRVLRYGLWELTFSNGKLRQRSQ
jgi:hypothetical protein